MKLTDLILRYTLIEAKTITDNWKVLIFEDEAGRRKATVTNNDASICINFPLKKHSTIAEQVSKSLLIPAHIKSSVKLYYP